MCAAYKFVTLRKIIFCTFFLSQVMFTQYLKRLSSVLRDVQKKCAEQISFGPVPGSGGAGSGCGRSVQQDDLTDLQWAFQFIQSCG